MKVMVAGKHQTGNARSLCAQRRSREQGHRAKVFFCAMCVISSPTAASHNGANMCIPATSGLVRAAKMRMESWSMRFQPLAVR